MLRHCWLSPAMLNLKRVPECLTLSMLGMGARTAWEGVGEWGRRFSGQRRAIAEHKSNHRLIIGAET